MQIDSAAKLATIISVVVGVFMSLSSWYTGRKIQESQDQVSELIKKEKSIGVDKGQMELDKLRNSEAAKLSAELTAPLARSFALQYKTYTQDKDRLNERFVLPGNLAPEIEAMYPAWANRQGLMVGRACEAEGLLARQVVVLVLKNVGKVEATDLVLTVLEKTSPMQDPAKAWYESPGPGMQPMGYDALARVNGWTKTEIPLPTLRGTDMPEAERYHLKVVLASLSGRSTLYGTILVPLQITWSDPVTKQIQHLDLLARQGAMLNAELTGAEIGRVGAICTKR